MSRGDQYLVDVWMDLESADVVEGTVPHVQVRQSGALVSQAKLVWSTRVACPLWALLTFNNHQPHNHQSLNLRVSPTTHHQSTITNHQSPTNNLQSTARQPRQPEQPDNQTTQRPSNRATEQRNSGTTEQRNKRPTNLNNLHRQQSIANNNVAQVRPLMVLESQPRLQVGMSQCASHRV